MPRGHKLAFATRLRRGVDTKTHGERRFVHSNRRQTFRTFAVAQRVADADFLDSGDGNDVARRGVVRFDPGQALEGQHRVDLGHAAIFVAVAHGYLLAGFNGAAHDATDADASDVGVVIER